MPKTTHFVTRPPATLDGSSRHARGSRAHARGRAAARMVCASVMLCALSCNEVDAGDLFPDDEEYTSTVASSSTSDLSEVGDSSEDGDSSEVGDSSEDGDSSEKGDSSEEGDSSEVGGGEQTFTDITSPDNDPDLADPLNDLDVDSPQVTEDLTYEPPGLIVDSRELPLSQTPRSGDEECADISHISYGRRRSTLGQGLQLSFGLVDSKGLPMSSKANQNCLLLSDLLDAPFDTQATSASATGAVTLILARPGPDEAAHQAIRHAVKQLFLSRPQGERVALFSWGEKLGQVTTFTTFYDTFADAVDRHFPAQAVDTPLDPIGALQETSEIVADIADDSHLWVRSVVAIAPDLTGADLPTDRPSTANPLWIVADPSESSSQLAFAADNLSDAVADASAALDEFRREGFVTLGVCAGGVEVSAKVASTSGSANLELTLKDALPEEMTGECDAQAAADYTYYDTKAVEMVLEGDAIQQHERLVDDRDGEETFPASILWSSVHALSPATVHLRGTSSLARCDPNRLSYTVNLDSGRERFFMSERDGALGTDEFFLIGMCLDPMYLNQFTANRLLKRVGVFIPGQKLVEFRVNGITQGVYLLMENMKEALIRSNSRVVSVLRRKDSVEVKFPEETDAAAVEQALADYEALTTEIEGLPGEDRIRVLSERLDLHRHMSYIAMESILNNVDWGNEPFFMATETLGSAGAQPFFTVQSWDQDDLFLGECAHAEAVEDELGLLGCVEDRLERAMFGAPTNVGGGRQTGNGSGTSASGDVVNDAMYALYVDVLEDMMDIFTEDVVNAAFDETARQLKGFAANSAIVDVMPDWSGSADVMSTIDNALADRKADFAAHQDLLRSNLTAYRELGAAASGNDAGGAGGSAATGAGGSDAN